MGESRSPTADTRPRLWDCLLTMLQIVPLKETRLDIPAAPCLEFGSGQNGNNVHPLDNDLLDKLEAADCQL